MNEKEVLTMPKNTTAWLKANEESYESPTHVQISSEECQ